MTVPFMPCCRPGTRLAWDPRYVTEEDTKFCFKALLTCAKEDRNLFIEGAKVSNKCQKQKLSMIIHHKLYKIIMNSY